MKFLSSLIILLWALLTSQHSIAAQKIRRRAGGNDDIASTTVHTTTKKNPISSTYGDLPDYNTKQNNNEVVWITTETTAIAEQLRSIDKWHVKHYNNGTSLVTAAVDPQERRLLESQGFHIETNHEENSRILQLGSFNSGQTNGIPGYPCYRTVEETLETGARIAAEHPTLAQWIDIGDSIEKREGNGGYDIFALVLTNTTITTTTPKPVFLGIFAIHAREYVTAELGTRFAEWLVDGYGVDPDITWLLDYHEVHLILQANPDGRHQAEQGDLWRKNTNTNYCGANSNRRGADLNRNFEYQWDCCGMSSTNPCDSDFQGTEPGSEPEVKAIQDYAKRIFPDQRGEEVSDEAPRNTMGVALDVHSFGDLVLWPWGHTHVHSANHKELETLGRRLAFFNKYDPMLGYDLYPTNGDSVDFLYGALGVAAYTYEIGNTFFEPCFRFESTILDKNLESLFHAAKVARAPYMIPSGPEALDVTATPRLVEPGTPVTITATLDDTRYQGGGEPIQDIASAELFIDLPPWDDRATAIPMTAIDGSFDESIENVQVTINTSDLLYGTHIVYVQGTDANGNVGLVGSVFLEIGEDACVDSPEGWTGWGRPLYDCDWFATGFNCAIFGDSSGSNGITANEACCACGGGSSLADLATDTTTNANDGNNEEVTTTTTTTTCADVEGWYDSDGDDCAWYEIGNRCSTYGNGYFWMGYTANGACCACGGGVL